MINQKVIWINLKQTNVRKIEKSLKNGLLTRMDEKGFTNKDG